jgi:hypothetical protein
MDAGSMLRFTQEAEATPIADGNDDNDDTEEVMEVEATPIVEK